MSSSRFSSEHFAIFGSLYKWEVCVYVLIFGIKIFIRLWQVLVRYPGLVTPSM